jgi:HAD superfamily hydrolase (TIGR01484 family)
MQPFSSFPASVLARIRVLATDVDDTVTKDGKIPSSTVECLEALGRAGLTVALVTGRPAGWAQALAAYLPAVRVAVAENGLVAFDGEGGRMELGPRRGPDFLTRLADNSARVRDAFGLEVTPDDAFRLFERAFVRPASFDAAALVASDRLVEPGFEVMASSIHIHVRPSGWGKAEGLLAVLRSIEPEASAAPDDFVLFTGDSSNDRSLFARLRRTSVGVANVTAYLDELGDDRPAYVTASTAALGGPGVASRHPVSVLSRPERGKVSRHLGGQTSPSFDRAPADVRRHEQAARPGRGGIEQRLSSCRRLARHHVQPNPTEPFGGKGVEQGGLVDHGASAGVDEDGVGSERGQERAIHHARGGRGERAVQGDHIRER